MRVLRVRWAFLCALLALTCCGAASFSRQPDLGSPSRSPRAAAPIQAAQQTQLPNASDSLKFAVIGDNGTGDPPQYDIAKQMLASHEKFPFTFVVMMGDNIYGSERPQDFLVKFQKPYQPLLDAGVKFYASLGNHDSREQRSYEYYNMGGKVYYSFKPPKQNARFFALESTYMDQDQLAWIEKELESSNEDWKICFFHHPLYSSARTHGSELKLRAALEPLFIKYGVSLVLNGHDHVYERIKPQNGITYFVEGSSGQLRSGDLRKDSPLTAKGFDTDQTFMMMEIEGDQLAFETISRKGSVVDSGTIERRKKP
jgi:predicted MPP superfamily phosphohydrolase